MLIEDGVEEGEEGCDVELAFGTGFVEHRVELVPPAELSGRLDTNSVEALIQSDLFSWAKLLFNSFPFRNNLQKSL